MKNKMGVCFIAHRDGAIGASPRSKEWYDKIEDSVKGKLGGMYPEIDFSFHEVEDMKDASKFLEAEVDSDAYIVFQLSCICGFAKPILQSGKPTLLVNETYGGSGDYLLEYSRALEKGKPVISVSSREVDSIEVLENVKILDVIGELKGSKALFIISPGIQQHLRTEFPLGVDTHSVIRSIWTQTGITPELLDVNKFVEEYYDHVDDKKAEELMEKWIEEAEANEEGKNDQIRNSAKLYYALKEAATDYDADAIAVDCIVLRLEGFLEAWPCLSFMELYKEGDIIPVCEADPYSLVSLLMMDYLAGLPGFVNDPAPDEVTDEVVYYHCYAPVNFCGPDEENAPYIITPAHLGWKHASVHTKLPTNGKITVVGYDPENSVMMYHMAEAVRNEYSEHACSTKLVGKTNAKALAENWRPRSGWHRVAFSGDWSEEIEKLATLMGLEVEREDK